MMLKKNNLYGYIFESVYIFKDLPLLLQNRPEMQQEISKKKGSSTKPEITSSIKQNLTNTHV